MCRSIETSLATFGVSAVCVAYILYRASRTPPVTPSADGVTGVHLRWLAAFVLTFASIQLVDAALWWTIRCGRRDLNRIVSVTVLPLVLMAEPLVAYYGAAYATGGRCRVAAYEWALWCYVAVSAAAWVGTCEWTEPCDADGGYLMWCGGPPAHHPDTIGATGAVFRVLFLFFLLAPFYACFPPGYLRALVLGLGTATFVLSFRHVTFGTRWCWGSNAISVFIALVLFLGRS